MRKSYFLAAAAVVAMVGCTNEDYFGANESLKSGEAAINFGTTTKKLTRADKKTGAEAAALLGNNFVVLGYKGSDTLSSSSVKVFDYYDVNYVANTAGTTESNSSNWEYVAQGVNGLSSVSSQTIKYWDFAKTQYDFIAFSKGQQSGTKTIDQLFTAVDLANLGTKAYTVTGTLDELKECYIADLLTVYNTSENVAGQPSFPNGPVTPIFRKLQSKIRLAFYETIPGYSVKNVVFYDAAGAAADHPTVFATGKTLAVGGDTEATMEISFPTIGKAKVEAEDYNQAAIKFTTLSGTGELDSNVEFDDLDYTSKDLDEKTTGDIWLGRSSNTATYAGENTETNDYAYTTVLPVGGQTGSVLNIKVDYTLESIDGSGEEITVHGATAQVPAIYTAWQPNYAYTYIFKISDQTNGLINPSQTDYVGLYPITFDAVVEGDIDGVQETITEVGAPSITTYQQGKVVTENDEYVSGKPVYVTVDNGETLTTDFWKAGATNLFTATLDAANPCQTLSEKAVANCFNATAFDPTGVSASYTVKDANDQELTLTKVTTGWTLETTIAQADAPHGVVINTNGTNTCVAKIAAPTSGTTYVFQYLQTPATYKAPDYNTLATETPYYTLTSAAGVDTYTKVSATGTETFKANTFVKTAPVASDAATGTTLTKGVVYLQKDGTKYTQFTAKGDEPFTADTYYTATFTKASGTLAKDAVYYVKQGQNVYEQRTVTAADGLVVAATDPYYTTTDLTVVAATNCTTLTKGTTYYKAETDADGNVTVTTLVAKGDEAITDWYTTCSAPVFYDNTVFNTFAAGTTYYTGTTDNGTGSSAPTAVTTATGKETSIEGKVVDTKPVYYYKVIKVQ